MGKHDLHHYAKVCVQMVFQYAEMSYFNIIGFLSYKWEGIFRAI